MTLRIITGLFDSRAEADRAADQLVAQVGVPRERVRIHAAEQDLQGGGLMDWLARIWRPEADFLPPEDRSLLAEGLRRGGAMVSAEVEEARLDQAMDVLEHHGAMDLDTLETEWRGAGWTGYTAHDDDIGFATYGQDVVVGRIPRTGLGDDAPSGVLGRLEAAADEARRDDASRTRTGVRDRARCRPRVRSYMWETGPENPPRDRT